MCSSHPVLTPAFARRAADTDGSGAIEYGEFEARRAFDAIDADGSGSLSRAELLSAFRAIAPASAQNPFLTRRQYETLLRRDVDAMFRRADSNGDGRISFGEFRRVADDILELQHGRVLASWMRTAGVSAIQP
eukprot:tig00000654_g2806.t1